MNLRLILSYILVFCFGFFASAQDSSKRYMAIDSLSFLYTGKDAVYISDFKGNLDTLAVDSDYDYETARLLKIKDKAYIVSAQGGMVWGVDSTQIKRLDNSYNHKMTFGSNVFVHKDTIFKFGGYGYWSNRNFITYFSDTTKEWEFYPINKDSYLPPAVSVAKGVYFNGQFFFDGGITVDSRDGTSKFGSNNVWRFDFIDKTWTDLGVSKFKFAELSESVSIPEGKLLVRKTMGDQSGLSYVLDYPNNTITEIEPIPSYFTIHNQLIANDSLYNYRQNVLIGTGLYDLTKNVLSYKSLYLDSNSLFDSLSKVISVVLLILIVILIYLFRKNRNRPRLTETGIVVNREHYSLNPKERIILNLLVYNKNINSKAIFDKIRDPNLSVAQNNKIKLDLIASMNKKVSKALGIKRFVHTKKSIRDKREVIYFTPNRKEFIL